MQLVVEKDGKVYTYTESFWTGKKELTVNGVPLSRVNKKTFSSAQGGAESYITVKGSFLTGITLITTAGNIELVKNKWYEWLLIFLPVVGLGLGVFGGAAGGFLSALFGMLGGMLNASVLRSKKPLALKIVACILVAAAVNAAWLSIYVGVVGGLKTAFPAIFG